MSEGYIFAAVTAVLRHVLVNGFAGAGVTADLGGGVLVTTLPPDRIAVGAEERPQVNLFLYQAQPNLAWRRGREERMAFDLHYLLSAYGANDLHGELLLAHSIGMLRAYRMLEGKDLYGAFTKAVGGEAFYSLMKAVESTQAGDSASDGPPALVQRLALPERIEVTPHALQLEELSRLWSACQARYRPSVAYKVSLVHV